MFPLLPLLPCVVASAVSCASVVLERPAVLEQPAVLGASMTDGFLLPLEADCMVTLADTVAATQAGDTELPERFSTTLFFLDPVEHGTRLANQALDSKPTLLVALDFLFWFGYGWTQEDQRLQRLELGLELLDQFPCPIVIADFPDLSRAAREGVGVHGRPMIAPGQVPDPATLELLNARLDRWARQRGDVVVVPLASLYDDLLAGRDVTVRGNTWHEGALEQLMDQDLLHPTLTGTIAVTMLACDGLTRLLDLPDGTFNWNVASVRESVLERRKAEREARRATAARRTR